MVKIMSHRMDRQLQQDLRTETSPKEAADLAQLGARLDQTPQPSRSRLAHAQTWDLITSRIDAEASTHRRRWLNWRFAAVPAIIAVTFIFVVVAQNSLPGDSTYAFKLAIENAQIHLAFSPSRKASACSMQMKRRANELAQLSAEQRSTATVDELSQSILAEAAEFKQYTAHAGSDTARLQSQRTRDIAYVTEALQFAAARTSNAQQLATISKTIATLQANV